MGEDTRGLIRVRLTFTRSHACILDPSEVREHAAKALFRCGQLIIGAKQGALIQEDPHPLQVNAVVAYTSVSLSATSLASLASPVLSFFLI